MLAPVYSATHLHWFPVELKRACSNDNCLMPMHLPWCYIAHVCWVFCVLSFFAFNVASGAVVRVLRALQHVFASTFLGCCAFMVQEPCLHPCTPPHILNGCVLLGLYVLYALCALYAFSKPYVHNRGPQKRASGQKRTDGRERNIYMDYTQIFPQTHPGR